MKRLFGALVTSIFFLSCYAGFGYSYTGAGYISGWKKGSWIPKIVNGDSTGFGEARAYCLDAGGGVITLGPGLENLVYTTPVPANILVVKTFSTGAGYGGTGFNGVFPRLGPASSAGSGGAVRIVDGVTFAQSGTGIQAAINDAIVSGGNVSGNVIYIPKGEYSISQTLVANSGSIYLVGAGPQATALVLANGVNAPILDLGGLASSALTNNIHISNIGFRGNSANQTVAAPLVRMRRCDRSRLDNLAIQDSKGQGLHIGESTVEVSSSEVTANLAEGIVVNASVDTWIHDNLIHDNSKSGILVMMDSTGYTGGNLQIRAPEEMGLSITRNMFNANGSLGAGYNDVRLDSTLNVTVSDNRLAPRGAQAVSIEVINGSQRNRILGNWFDRGAWDQVTNPTYNQSIGLKTTIGFSSRTHDNVYGFNALYHNGAGSEAGPIDLRSLVTDLGRNYSFDYEGAQVRSFARGSVNHPLGGWASDAITNSALYSQDLLNVVWVSSDPGATIALSGNDTVKGSPVSASGSATYFQYNSNNGVHTLTQTITGLSIAAGDKVTFSVFGHLANAPTVGHDFRLKILDGSNTILSQTAFRFNEQTWERYATTFVAAASYSTLKIVVERQLRNAALTVRWWGAQLNKGDLAPYIPTTGIALTVPPGLIGMQATFSDSARFNKGFQVGGRFIPKLDGASASLNFGVPAAVPGSVDATISVPGAAFGNRIAVGAPITIGANYILTGFVSAAGTVTIRWTQIAGAAADPDGAGGTYTADVIQ